MTNEEECCHGMHQHGGKGIMIVLAALLLAVGMIGGAYVFSKGDYAPKVDLSGFKSTPNVYVTPNPSDHAITVSATADEKVTPDLLQIQLHVQTEAPNAKDSQTENAQVSSVLLDKLHGMGLADKDIQTISYNVNQVTQNNYTCDKNGMNCVYNYYVTGYQTTHTLVVNVYALDKGGDVIDAASQAGTNETFIDSTSFTLKDATRSAISKALLKNASTEAHSKAQNIADGLGASLGKLLYANENTYYPQPYYNTLKDMSVGAAAAPTTQLSPGTVDVSVSVGVSYEIAGSS